MITFGQDRSRNRITQYSVLLIAMGFAVSANAGVLSYDSTQGLQASASCNSGNGFAIDNSDVTLNNGSPMDATECFGAYSGNNSTAALTWNSVNWDHIAKIDINEDGASQQTSQNITVDFGGSVDEDGNWSYSGDFSNWGSFFLVTKAANNPGWAAYYFDDLDGLNSLGGTFTIPWNTSSGNPPALSHIDLYAKTVARVPEPATLGLMGLGLLGLGLRRNRK